MYAKKCRVCGKQVDDTSYSDCGTCMAYGAETQERFNQICGEAGGVQNLNLYYDFVYFNRDKGRYIILPAARLGLDYYSEYE